MNVNPISSVYDLNVNPISSVYDLNVSPISSVYDLNLYLSTNVILLSDAQVSQVFMHGWINVYRIYKCV